jgi:hypothetical protein
VLSSCGLPLPPTCILLTVDEALSYFASTIIPKRVSLSDIWYTWRLRFWLLKCVWIGTWGGGGIERESVCHLPEVGWKGWKEGGKLNCLLPLHSFVGPHAGLSHQGQRPNTVEGTIGLLWWVYLPLIWCQEQEKVEARDFSPLFHGSRIKGRKYRGVVKHNIRINYKWFFAGRRTLQQCLQLYVKKQLPLPGCRQEVCGSPPSATRFSQYESSIAP